MQEGVDCRTRLYNHFVQVIRGVSKSPVREETCFAERAVEGFALKHQQQTELAHFRRLLAWWSTDVSIEPIHE